MTDNIGLIDTNGEKGYVYKNQIRDELLPLAANHVIGIHEYNGGLDGFNYPIDVNFGVVENMISGVGPKITFEIKSSATQNSGAWSAKFMVLFMTKPLATTIEVVNIANPPLWAGSPKSKIYVIGLKISGDEKAPKYTPWLSLGDLNIIVG